MIATIAPLLMDNVNVMTTATNVKYVAAPIWDIGANIKNQGISFAVYMLLGGSAVLSAISYFVVKNKTAALKTLAIGVVLAGLVGSLPALGVVSRDTVNGLTNTGGTR